MLSPSFGHLRPPDIDVIRIDHINYAVADLEATMQSYLALLGGIALDPTTGQRLARWRGAEALEVGQTIYAAVETPPLVYVLTQGTDPSSPVAQFVEEHGSGIHHIAYLVDDVHRVARQLADQPVELLTDVISSECTQQVFCRTGPMIWEFIERDEPHFRLPAIRKAFEQVESDALTPDAPQLSNLGSSNPARVATPFKEETR